MYLLGDHAMGVVVLMSHEVAASIAPRVMPICLDARALLCALSTCAGEHASPSESRDVHRPTCHSMCIALRALLGGRHGAAWSERRGMASKPRLMTLCVHYKRGSCLKWWLAKQLF